MGTRLPDWIVILAVLLAVPIVYFSGRGLRWLVGPLAAYEAGRHSRRPRTRVLRCGMGLLILLILFLIYPNAEDISIQEQSRMANMFSEWYLGLQFAFVLILTPVMAAGAITDERQTHRLDFLLATPLSNREIILGKLAGRLMGTADILVSGLPALALTQLWGGVDFTFLLGVILMTLSTGIAVASIAVAISSFSQSTWNSVLGTHAASLVLVIASTCISAASHGNSNIIISSLIVAMINSMVAFAAVLVAMASIREPLLRVLAPAKQVEAPKPAPVPPASDPVESEPKPVPGPPAVEGLYLGLLRRIRLGNWPPLIWKEVCFGIPSNAVGPALGDAGLFISIISLALMGLMDASFSLSSAERLPSSLCGAFEFFFWSAAIVTVAGALYRGAAPVASERERRTLDSLFVLPFEPHQILRAKQIGVAFHGLRGFLILILTLLIGTLVKAIHPVSALASLFAVAVHFILAVQVSTLISCFCSTVARARLLVFSITVVFLGVTSSIAFDAVMTSGPKEDNPFLIAQLCINPITSWNLIYFDLAHTGTGLKVLPSAMMVIAVYAAIAVVLHLVGRGCLTGRR